MRIVGERINTSRQAVNEAVKKGDAAYILADVKKQAGVGVHYIDLNAGSRIGSEMEDLTWLVEVAEAAVEGRLLHEIPEGQPGRYSG